MGKRMLIILLIVLLLVLLAGAVFVYLYVFKQDDPIALGQIYSLPETFMTDLSGGHHIRVEVSLELGDKKLVKEVDRRKAQIVDTIYLILRGKTRAELSGSQGQDQLRTEILDQLNELFTTGKLLRVYFNQIVID